MNDVAVFHPVRRLRLGDGEVAVRELAWPEALELMGRIAGWASGGPGAPAAPLPALLAHGGGDLVGFLLAHATDLPEERLRTLPAGAAVRIAAAALELTLNDEVIAAGKAAAERLRRTFGPPSPRSSTSSSPAATPTPGATRSAS